VLRGKETNRELRLARTIIGIDPGTRHLGWGVITTAGTKIDAVSYGVIHTSVDAPLTDKLMEIDDALEEILGRLQPHEAGVESIFFSKDAQAAAKLGHARGVVLLRMQRAGLSVAEYAPAQVKSMVVGRGRADKLQVATMVTALLRLRTRPPADAADALAVAITHARMSAVTRLLATKTR